MSIEHLVVLSLCVISVKNRMLPKCDKSQAAHKENIAPENIQEERDFMKVKDCYDKENREFVYDTDLRRNSEDTTKNPCSIVVLSNIQNPKIQSLIRKYRYDSRGSLIPSSVKYYVKIPRGLKSPVLVPLNDKAFSPLGGFVRYYKEVPPIPQSW